MAQTSAGKEEDCMRWMKGIQNGSAERGVEGQWMDKEELQFRTGRCQ
jgi:hypothetical protein